MILLGDAIEMMSTLEDESVDMILCDLPYGTTQNKWDSIIPFDKMWEQFNRICKSSAAMAFTSAEPFTSNLILSNIKMFRYDLIWEKSHATGFLNANKMPLRKHENILLFYRKPPIYNAQLFEKEKENIRPVRKKNRQSSNYGVFDSGDHRIVPISIGYPASILKHNIEQRKYCIHPTQKPVSLFEWLIKSYTNPDCVILDCCAGSMTTAIAAINTRRKYICIERDEQYYNEGFIRVIKHLKHKLPKMYDIHQRR